MVTDNEIRLLSVSERLFAYADAYLLAATTMCGHMAHGQQSANWPQGAVVLMLSAHSVELFLKGAILARSPTENVWARNHNLEKLREDYQRCFQEPDFAWDIPFSIECLGEFDEVEIAQLKGKTPEPSILYRYPVQKNAKEWEGCYGFEPHSFSVVLKEVRKAFDRIRRLLNS